MRCSILTRVGVVWLAAWLGLGEAAAAPGLEAYQGQWPDLELKAALAAPAGSQVEQGADLQIRLSSEAPARLAIALEDGAHQVRIYVPHRRGTADQLVPGTEFLYPDLGLGETLYADLPVGHAVVWAIVSDGALFADSAGPGQPMDVATVIRRIGAMRLSGTASHVTVARIPIEVVAPALKDYVSTQDFVSFYAVRTRSVSGADRGFRIGFKHNSAELDEWSRKQLEAVGAGMRDPQLASYRFALEGHTDDQGSQDYNLDLSLRRAQTVRDFLAQQSRIPASRLTTQGFGKEHPAVPGTDEASRAQNRRVVIRRLDDSAH